MTPISKKHIYITCVILSRQERDEIFMMANELAAADAMVSGKTAGGDIERFSIRRYTEKLMTILMSHGITKRQTIHIDYCDGSVIYTQIRTEFLAV